MKRTAMMKSAPWILVFATAIFFSLSALAEKWKATLYALDSNRQKIVGTCEKNDGDVYFRDPDGKEQIHEIVTFDESGKLKRYEMKESQDNELGIVDVRDGRIYFSYTKKGETKKDDEEWVDNFIIGPTTLPFIMKHWAEVIKGDTVSARFGVLDRRESVGFKFFKINETKVDGQDAVVVKMKPTSFVIAALVDPLIFTFNKEGTKILSIVGRTLPKQLIKGEWKDLDCESVYKYTD